MLPGCWLEPQLSVYLLMLTKSRTSSPPSAVLYGGIAGGGGGEAFSMARDMLKTTAIVHEVNGAPALLVTGAAADSAAAANSAEAEVSAMRVASVQRIGDGGGR